MNYNLRKSKFRLILVIVIVIILFLCLPRLLKTDYIKIQNQTDANLSGMSINYSYSNKEKAIVLPNIRPMDDYEINLFPDDFKEGSIKTSYTNSSGNRREEYIAGYLEKGYHTKITVIVKSADEDGNLLFQIQ